MKMGNHQLRDVAWVCVFACSLSALMASAQIGDGEAEMVYVPGGAFTMGCTQGNGEDCFGNETPAHEVLLSGFYIGKYEVTQAQWAAVMGKPEWFRAEDSEKPADGVSFADITGTSGTVLYTEKGVDYRSDGFCGKLYQKTGKKYRLPTEAEWEFAARGGNESSGYTYSGGNEADEVAWYNENSRYALHPVGRKQPNELGIYDMSGNVWEWCSDWFGLYNHTEMCNPHGPSSGSDRVLRGGGAGDNIYFIRISVRVDFPPGLVDDFRYGFRLALSADGKEKGGDEPLLEDVPVGVMLLHH